MFLVHTLLVMAWKVKSVFFFFNYYYYFMHNFVVRRLHIHFSSATDEKLFLQRLLESTQDTEVHVNSIKLVN